jgi:hypothetical protein
VPLRLQLLWPHQVLSLLQPPVPLPALRPLQVLWLPLQPPQRAAHVLLGIA